MNERIEKLVTEAFFDESTNGPDEKMYTLGERKMQLFADLIVRECVNVALEQKKWVEDQEVFNPHDESWNRARIQQSQHIVDKINEHFGVKE